MQIEIEQWQHSGGTVEASCKVKAPYGNADLYYINNYMVSKLKTFYYFEFVGFETKQVIPMDFKLFIGDLVEDTKNLSDLDWQLLKITNSDVHVYQWQIFKLLKDLLDNRTTEDYTVSEIKEILAKYEI
jgi:hypothetical protein